MATGRGKKQNKVSDPGKGKTNHLYGGLYNMFKDADGLSYVAATIITTAANPDVAFIHDRMPVILKDDALRLWLDKDNADLSVLQELLNPYEAGKMDFKVA